MLYGIKQNVLRQPLLIGLWQQNLPLWRFFKNLLLITKHINPYKHANSVSDNVRKFVQKELKSIELTRYNKIKIVCSHYLPSIMAAFNNCIFIDPLCLHSIKTILRKKNKTKKDNETLDEYRFAVRHEGRHIKYNHQHLSIISNLLLPIITHAVVIFMCKKFNINHPYLIKPIEGQRFNIKQFLKNSGAGFGMFILNNALDRLIKRQFEKQADCYYENDIKILKAGMKYFIKRQKNATDQWSNQFISVTMLLFNSLPILRDIQIPYKYNYITRFIRFMSKYNPTHPSYNARIKMLKNRIAYLKKRRKK